MVTINNINLLAECINNEVLGMFVDSIEYHSLLFQDIHYSPDKVEKVKKWCTAVRLSIEKDKLTNRDRRGIVLEYLLVEARVHQDKINKLG